MSPKFWPWIVCGSVLGMLSGCGTTMNLFGLMDDVAPPRYPFGGTIIDVTHALQPGGGYDGIGYVLAMDIPFSIVGDAVMLPITIPHTCLAQYVDHHRERRATEPRRAERMLEIENDLGQKENKATGPWNEEVSDEQSELPPVPAE